MQNRTLTLIINPVAGTLSKHGLERWVLPELKRMGYGVTVRYTKRPGHATELAREASLSGHYGVLACGGDGTVNEVARGLIDSGTALGILPAGSGNGLARHIGIPVDVMRSLKVIAEDRVVECDYGDVNGKPFFCTFGVGFDAAVSERFARKHTRGLMTYIASTIDEFVNYDSRRYEIVADDRVITDKAFLVVVCNASQYGNNAFVAPAASIRDGLLDVTIVHDGTPLTNALSGLEILTGMIGNHGNIQTFRTAALTIRRSSPATAHIDGDPVEMPEVLDVRCHPGKLKIFTTANKLKFLPILTPMALTVRDWHICLTRLLGIH